MNQRSIEENEGYWEEHRKLRKRLGVHLGWKLGLFLEPFPEFDPPLPGLPLDPINFHAPLSSAFLAIALPSSRTLVLLELGCHFSIPFSLYLHCPFFVWIPVRLAYLGIWDDHHEEWHPNFVMWPHPSLSYHGMWFLRELCQRPT
jgi:hypothetical protein